jgi:hypothetical protein
MKEMKTALQNSWMELLMLIAIMLSEMQDTGNVRMGLQERMSKEGAINALRNMRTSKATVIITKGTVSMITRDIMNRMVMIRNITMVRI